MDRFIGLDAHASSCTLGVVSPSGKRVGSHVVETNARCLIEAVRQIPEPRHVCLEEGTLSGWLYEVLSPHAERVVVTAVRESRGSKDEGYPREAWVEMASGSRMRCGWAPSSVRSTRSPATSGSWATGREAIGGSATTRCG